MGPIFTEKSGFIGHCGGCNIERSVSESELGLSKNDQLEKSAANVSTIISGRCIILFHVHHHSLLHLRGTQ